MPDRKRNFVLLPVLLAAVLLTLLAASLALCLLRGDTCSLHLPSSADVAELIVSQGAREAHIDGWEEVDAVNSLLLGESRTTTRESTQDAPVNVENMIQFDFVFSGGGVSTLFAYEREGRCWLEQPYNGIYPLSREEFAALAALLPAGA